MAKTQVNLIDEKYLQAFLEHIKKINFTTNFKKGYLVGSGEGKGTPLSTNAETIITAINELVDALPKSTSADGVNTYKVQSKTIGKITNLSATDVEGALSELATATNYNFSGYIKNTDGSVDIDSAKIKSGADKTKDGGKDYSADTKLATQGYVYEKIGEINNTTVAVKGGKDGDITTVSFTKDGGTNNYYITLTSNDGSETAIGFDATDFIKDGYLSDVKLDINEDKEDVLVFTFNADADKETIEVPLKKFVDTYTKGNGIDITANKVTAVADGYVKVDTSGIQLDSTKITTANAEDDDKNADNLSSQGYVDEQIVANAYVVSALTFDATKFDLVSEETTNG